MIKGIGTDLIELDRIARVYFVYRDRLLNRIFTDRERSYFEKWSDPVPRVAGRFAAKEAVMKALGTGWADGVRWRDIEVTRQSSGKPEVVLHGRCREIFDSLGATRIHCTITHSRDYAMAVVMFE
jgi:holo-[acyl-carrier protein] synthase